MLSDTPFSLSRITTRYDELEDRILVSGQAAEDTVFNAWFTRRLLDRLVASLSRILSPSEQHGLEEILNDFAQDKAEASLIPTPAVTPLADGKCISALITAVDLQIQPGSVRIVMRSESCSSAVLPLTHRELRQWLSILRAAYRLAAWPTGIWPAWLLDRKVAHSPPPSLN
mgnify:CR=1 FL=1